MTTVSCDGSNKRSLFQEDPVPAGVIEHVLGPSRTMRQTSESRRSSQLRSGSSPSDASDPDRLDRGSQQSQPCNQLRAAEIR